MHWRASEVSNPSVANGRTMARSQRHMPGKYRTASASRAARARSGPRPPPAGWRWRRLRALRSHSRRQRLNVSRSPGVRDERRALRHPAQSARAVGHDAASLAHMAATAKD